MRRLYLIWIFYRKLLFPSVVVSVLLGLLSMEPNENFSLTSFGVAWLFVPLLFQVLIYELRNPQEYYFYYNTGLSKIHLYAATALISFVTGLILILV